MSRGNANQNKTVNPNKTAIEFFTFLFYFFILAVFSIFFLIADLSDTFPPIKDNNGKEVHFINPLLWLVTLFFWAVFQGASWNYVEKRITEYMEEGWYIIINHEGYALTPISKLTEIDMVWYRLYGIPLFSKNNNNDELVPVLFCAEEENKKKRVLCHPKLVNNIFYRSKNTYTKAYIYKTIMSSEYFANENLLDIRCDLFDKIDIDPKYIDYSRVDDFIQHVSPSAPCLPRNLSTEDNLNRMVSPPPYNNCDS